MKKGLKKVIVGFMATMVLSMGCATVCMAEESCNHDWYKTTEYVYEVPNGGYCPAIGCKVWIKAVTEELKCRNCEETVYLHMEYEQHTAHATKY